jgi:hypothetical protein
MTRTLRAPAADAICTCTGSPCARATRRRRPELAHRKESGHHGNIETLRRGPPLSDMGSDAEVASGNTRARKNARVGPAFTRDVLVAVAVG